MLFFVQLTQDSEQQMILTARRSLVAKVARHQAPQIDIFFLNILVRRSHLVCDSLNEVSLLILPKKTCLHMLNILFF